MEQYSFSPDNYKFLIPNRNKTKIEVKKIRETCKLNREKGKKIVLVQGLGFVGAIMGAIIADCEKNQKSKYFVIGMDLPLVNSFWKIPTVNMGKSPIKAKDSNIDKIFKRTVLEKKSYLATWIYEAYSEADIIIVDINLDINKPNLGKAEEVSVSLSNFKNAISSIGKHMRKDALVLIETTIPPGTIEKIAQPLIEKCFKERSIDIEKNPVLLAHSYERIMPGINYIDSVKKMRRTFAATNEESRSKTIDFLSDIINIEKYPLWELNKPLESELAKVLENSYRAMNIAFMYEWALFAEEIGVNLFEVIDSIRVRKGTHDNMMYPGFGVGGYCLPKDPLLAEWASKHIFERKKDLDLTVKAVNINDLMPHHTFDLLSKGLNDNLKGKKITILGVSYRKDIDDTRNSPTIILYDDIIEFGGEPILHDPYVRIVYNHEDIKIENDINFSLTNASAVIFVVDHKEYMNLSMKKIVNNVKYNACIVDAFNILSDEKISYLKDQGLKVLGVGKGHIKYL